MRIDFSRVLVDFEGKPIKESNAEDSKNVDLRRICINALMVNDDRDKIEGTEKLKRYQLAQKILNGTNDVSAEEISKLKELIGKYFGTIIVGQAFEILEKEK